MNGYSTAFATVKEFTVQRLLWKLPTVNKRSLMEPLKNHLTVRLR